MGSFLKKKGLLTETAQGRNANMQNLGKGASSEERAVREPMTGRSHASKKDDHGARRDEVRSASHFF